MRGERLGSDISNLAVGEQHVGSLRLRFLKNSLFAANVIMVLISTMLHSTGHGLDMADHGALAIRGWTNRQIQSCPAVAARESRCDCLPPPHFAPLADWCSAALERSAACLTIYWPLGCCAPLHRAAWDRAALPGPAGMYSFRCCCSCPLAMGRMVAWPTHGRLPATRTSRDINSGAPEPPVAD